jgi:pyridinium-3,5-bisthiocarboxylic acid mononucleotide nickel chelatase
VRLLYVDCFSGAAGDMLLGALIDAGVPLGEIRQALGSLAVDPDVIWTERVTRAGVSATRFRVRGEGEEREPHHHHHEHGHDHHPHGHGPHTHEPHHHDGGHDQQHEPQEHHQHHQPHRTLAEIGRLIDGSALSAAGKRRAIDLFTRLGEVEAAIHGTTLDRIHLHEVGALDSIIDIAGTVFAFEYLGIERVVASPLNVGSGTIRSAHGLYPVPAPATMQLLQGVPVYAGAQQVELVTPTGALLVTGYASGYGAIPPMRVDRIGYGAGSRDLPDTPNVLRVLLGEAEAAAATGHRVVVLETEIDDMNPQIFGTLMDQLLAHGALDVFYTAVQMKKNRPGTLLTVVAPPEARERLSAIIFRETTTIGIRYQETARECLDRETVTVATPLGDVRVKVARRGGRMLNVAPEFDDCLRIAGEHRRPLKEIQALAVTAFFERTEG